MKKIQSKFSFCDLCHDLVVSGVREHDIKHNEMQYMCHFSPLKATWNRILCVTVFFFVSKRI